MRVRNLRAAFVLSLALATATPPPAEGYFLTATQKKDLLLSGQMSDNEGRLYDVWIVPGYEVPLRDGRRGWHDAGDSLADYGRAKFYGDIGKASRDTWRHGTSDTLKEFALRGTKLAWEEDMGLARQRTEKRVFGWWLAYPWGVFEAITQSFVRLGGGIPAGLAISASAYTVVPVVHFGAPVPKSALYAAGPGFIAPLAAVGWNTVIAPPLALLGEQPAPERADGFWMTMVSPTAEPAAGMDEAVAAATAWRDGLVQAAPADSLEASFRSLDAERDTRTRELQAQIDAVDCDIEARKAAARELWFDTLLAVARERSPQLRAELQSTGLSAADTTPAVRQALEAALVDEHVSAEEARLLLDLVLRPADGPDTPPPPTAPEKTDPLKRSLEILENP